MRSLSNMRVCVLAMLAVSAAVAQRPVEFAVIGGAPITETFDTSTLAFESTGFQQGASATRRYTLGAGLLVRLPHGFGVEIDGLYQRLGYDLNDTQSPDIPVVREHTWTTANSFEFPLLGSYRLPFARGLRPFVLAGVSVRAVTGATTTGQCYPLAPEYAGLCLTTAPVPQAPDPHLNLRSSFGGTFGAGIAARLGPLGVRPQLRYSRWGVDRGGCLPDSEVCSQQNQLDFLLSVTF